MTSRPRRFITRRRLAELNAQDWADFRAHWPMHVFWVLRDLAGGFAFGLCLGLALLLWALSEVAR